MRKFANGYNNMKLLPEIGKKESTDNEAKACAVHIRPQHSVPVQASHNTVLQLYKCTRNCSKPLPILSIQSLE